LKGETYVDANINSSGISVVLPKSVISRFSDTERI